MACIIDRQERARRIARCHRPLRPPTIRSQMCDTLKQLITALPVMLMVAQPTSRDFLFLFGLRLPSVGPRFAGNDHSAGRFMGIAEPYTLIPVNSDRPLHSTGELHCPPSPIYARCCTCHAPIAGSRLPTIPPPVSMVDMTLPTPVGSVHRVPNPPPRGQPRSGSQSRMQSMASQRSQQSRLGHDLRNTSYMSAVNSVLVYN